MNELTDGEHIIFGLQCIGDDVGAKWNQFYAFEFAANLPADVVDAELDLRGSIKEQQHSHLMEHGCDLLRTCLHCQNTIRDN